MSRVAKRARSGALTVSTLLLAGCAASAPSSYTIESSGTGGTEPEPGIIGPVVAVPSSKDIGGYQPAPDIPKDRGMIPRPRAAEVGRAPVNLPSDPPPIDPPSGASPPCVGWWRSCHFF